MFDVEYDEKEGMIAIDGTLYSVEEAEGLMSELYDALQDCYESRAGRPDDIYEYERDEMNS